MQPLTVAAARAIDRDASERLQMPTLLLMENAARAVAATAATMAERAVILCGPGNNGGDGLAAARHLGRERAVVALLAEPDGQKSPDAALQLRILRAAGWPILLGSLPDLSAHRGAVIVDALFGTGLERPLRGMPLAWVEAMNAAAGPRLCVDIPSGLHGDLGTILGAAVRAEVTVTFVAPKVGMTIGEGPRCCGRLVVAGLGLP